MSTGAAVVAMVRTSRVMVLASWTVVGSTHGQKRSARASQGSRSDEEFIRTAHGDALSTAERTDASLVRAWTPSPRDLVDETRLGPLPLDHDCGVRRAAPLGVRLHVFAVQPRRR